MEMLIVKLLYQLYGEFSICLFVYGILWLAEAICDNKDIPLAVVTAVGGLACVFITGIIYEEYEL